MPHRRTFRAGGILYLFIALLASSSGNRALAADRMAAGWRGDGTGVVRGASPPLTWSDDKNVLWKSPLPNWGNGQPVACDGIVVTLSEPLQTAPLLSCFDAESGRLLWERQVEHLQEPLRTEFATFVEQLRKANRYQARHFAARMADDKKAMADIEAEIAAAGFSCHVSGRKAKGHVSVYPAGTSKSWRKKSGRFARKGAVLPTWTIKGDSHHPGYSCWEGRTFAAPVTNGRHIWVWLSPGVAACYDRQGQLQWLRHLNPFADGGKVKGKYPDCKYTSSPVMINGVFVCVGGDRIYGLEAETGQTLWQCATRHSQRWEPQAVVTIRLEGAVGVLAHDGLVYAPEDGRVLLDLPNPDEGSAVALGDRVYMQSHGRKRIASGFRLSRNDGGEWTAETLWTERIGLAKDHDNRTPLAYGRRLYAAAGIVDADTGKVLVAPSRKKNSEGLPVFFHSHSSAWLAGKYLLCHGPEWKTAKGRSVPPAVTRVCDPETLEVLAINRLSPAPAVGKKLEQLMRHSTRGALGWGPKGLQTLFVEGSRLYIRNHDYLFCIGE